MVGRPGPYQFSCNSGELAPAVWGNTGLKQYYAGLAQCLNCEPVPQGGARLMPRSRYRDTVPRVVDPVTGRAACRLLSFGIKQGLPYVVALTQYRANIFKSGVHVASRTLPYAAGELSALQVAQRFDTMLIWHPDHAMGRLLYGGSDTSWSFDYPPFSNLPQVQYDGSYADTDEIWVVSLEWAPTDSVGATYNPTGTNFTLEVNGASTPGISFSAGTDQSAAIAAALVALPTVEPGIAVAVYAMGTRDIWYSVTFSGNGGANFSVSGQTITSNPFALNTYRYQIGRPGGEDLISTGRGYASAGCFYQDRLVVGGFRSKLSALGMSRTGEYFDLNDQITGAASGGLLLNLSTDGPETIVAMVQAAHLVIFTDSGDYYVADRAISATAAPAIVDSERHGISRRVPVVRQEGGLVYVNSQESTVFSATFDAVSEKYVSTPLSLLSSHLMVGLSGAALQKATADTDNERYWMTRDDGTMVVGLFIRNQDIAAFVRWETDGTVLAVTVDGNNVPVVVVERQVAGAPVLCLETLETGLLLDAAVTQSYGTPQTAVTGLTMHEGAQVYALADGIPRGPFTVTAGAIALPVAASSVTVGRWTPPLLETLPLVRDVAEHTVLKRPARVHSVKLDVMGTSSLALGANGRAPRPMTLQRHGLVPGAPPPAVTGQIAASGLKGFSPDGRVQITQKLPGTFQIRDITVEAQI